jgi:putative flippase GtrA
LLACAAGLLLTSAALAGLHLVSARPPRVAEVIVLLLANLAATVLRFLLYRSWVFRARPASPAQARHATVTTLRPPRDTAAQPEGSDR